MTPGQIAKTSEHSQQAALFCYTAKAASFGFAAADDPKSYGNYPEGINHIEKHYCITDGKVIAFPDAVPALKWFHAIPNGGDRDKITAGKMKAEGVRSGIWDTFLPVPRKGFAGLYIEMKKPGMQTAKNGGLSDNQVEFGNFAVSQGYKCAVCYTWIEAVNILKEYLT
jgi:hypothetical protein